MKETARLQSSRQSSRQLILGIDPGLRRTGWGLITRKPSSYTNGRQGKSILRYIDCGVIVPNPKQADGLRLNTIFTALQELLIAKNPHAVAIETVFVNQNPKTSILLGQARGVALLAAARADHQPHSFSPLEVKRSVCGVAFADKDQIALHVHQTLPATAEEKRGDALDALAIAICYANFCLQQENTPLGKNTPPAEEEGKKQTRKTTSRKNNAKTKPKTKAKAVKAAEATAVSVNTYTKATPEIPSSTLSGTLSGRI